MSNASHLKRRIRALERKIKQFSRDHFADLIERIGNQYRRKGFAEGIVEGYRHGKESKASNELRALCRAHSSEDIE